VRTRNGRTKDLYKGEKGQNKMSDYLVRGMSMDGFVKVVAIRSTELVRRGAEIQKTTPNEGWCF